MAASDGSALSKPTAISESSRNETVTSGPINTNISNPLPGFFINRRGQRGKSSSQSPSRMATLGLNLKRVARVSSRNLNNLARSKLYNSFPNLARKDSQISQQVFNVDDENVRKVLKAVESDHVIATSAEDNRHRRTVFLQKSDSEKFGFTIQSYTFRHSSSGETERITYVDYVELDSPAFVAGLRAGDVILAINGRNVQSASHNQLVACVSQSPSLRMVVLFENCVNRIELCARAIKLQRLLADKEFEYRTLCAQEERILSGRPPLTDVEILASLRTPCHTPRSASFALPYEGDTTSCGGWSTGPLEAAKAYYLLDKYSRSDSQSNDSRSDVTVFAENDGPTSGSVHCIEILDVDPAAHLIDCPAASDFAAGGDHDGWRGRRSATESDLGALSANSVKPQNCTLKSALDKAGMASEDMDSYCELDKINGDGHENGVTVDHGNELALVHVLHVDDSAAPILGQTRGDAAPTSVTRF